MEKTFADIIDMAIQREEVAYDCQSASKTDPPSASKIDPPQCVKYYINNIKSLS